jgi:hypothetical protein
MTDVHFVSSSIVSDTLIDLTLNPFDSRPERLSQTSRRLQLPSSVDASVPYI